MARNENLKGVSSMKKFGIALALTLVFAPSALAQTPSTNANQNAAVKACKNLEAQMGAKRFNQAFAPRTWNARAADRNCARKEAVAQQQARVNAAHTCKTWQAGEDAVAMAAFAERFGTGATFASIFGTEANAYGKCVSMLAKEQNQERRAAIVNASKTCAAARRDTDGAADAFAGLGTLEGQTFAGAFGSDKNAYGKCVSTVAKLLAAAKQAEETTTP
jgi:hypothetical protein